MDRRNFVKIGAAGLVGAMEAERKPGAAGKNNPDTDSQPLQKRPSGSPPRVLFHCHCFPPNEQKFPRDPDTGLFPGSPEHLAVFSKRLGFDYATALSPFEVPEGRCTSRIAPPGDGLAWLEKHSREHRERTMLFASLNPRSPESPERLAQARERGFKGVKFHPVICRFPIDAGQDREFYGLLNMYRMPLLIHTGVFSGGEPWPLEEYSPMRIDRLANRFPQIPIIVAHGGGRAFCREMLGFLQSHRNAYLDLTHSLDEKYTWHIPADDMEAFFHHLGPSRIIYGVDYPWFSEEDFKRDLAYLEKLGLDERELARVLGGNFLSILDSAAK